MSIIVDQCSWDNPGAMPFIGDRPAAVAAYVHVPSATQAKLAKMIERHEFTDVAEITRDAIAGHDGAQYSDLRWMHFGTGRVCRNVTRQKWSDAMTERALIFCADDVCVAIPTVCGNVSLVTRVPPAAAPAPVPIVPEPELPFEPPGAIAGPPDVPVLTLVPTPVPPTFEDGAGPPHWLPPPFYAGPPVYFVPGVPPGVPVTPAIPEPGTWALLLAGVALLALRRVR